MKQCEVYKLKEGKDIKSSFSNCKYFYVDSFYPRLHLDGSSTKITEFAIIEIDLETMELSQLLGKYIVNEEVFNELFEPEPFMKQEDVIRRARELHNAEEEY